MVLVRVFFFLFYSFVEDKHRNYKTNERNLYIIKETQHGASFESSFKFSYYSLRIFLPCLNKSFHKYNLKLKLWINKLNNHNDSFPFYPCFLIQYRSCSQGKQLSNVLPPTYLNDLSKDTPTEYPADIRSPHLKSEDREN